MISSKIRCHLAGAFIALVVAASGRADLFVDMQPQNQIWRIDSSTGSVLQTYVNPFRGSTSVTAGLTFDGQSLYMTRHNPNAFFDELLTLDAVNDMWMPPQFISTLPNPSGQPQAISGLGMMGDAFGLQTLVAVTRNPAGEPPSFILQYQMFPPFFEPFVQDPLSPAGLLPPTMDAQGADIDRATGELWITASEITGTGRFTRLLHTDFDGNILQTLTPPLASPTTIRGLAFDDGAMFIAGRDVPTTTNSVYKIDRTSGQILQSFSLGTTGNVAGLAGGSLVPEPTIVSIAAVGIFLMSMRRGITGWRVG